MRKITTRLKQLFPWAFAAALFWYLFRQYPPAQLWQALQHVHLVWFLLFALAYFLAMYVLDSCVMAGMLRRLGFPVRLKDALQARGATYALMVVNYPASQAAFAYYLRRRFGTPIVQALGLFVVVMAVDLLWLCLMALIGSAFQEYTIAGMAVANIIRTFAVTGVVGFAAWIALWRAVLPRLQRTGRGGKLAAWLLHHPSLALFSRATLGDYVQLALARAPIHVMLISFMYVVLLLCNAHAPFAAILGNMPPIFFLGSLPLTPGGLGTVNLAIVTMLSPYTTGPHIASGEIAASDLIFAATLLWMFCNYSLKALTGSILLATSSRALFSPLPEVPEELAEQEAAHFGSNIP